jgi:hypothetical protein
MRDEQAERDSADGDNGQRQAAIYANVISPKP